MKEYMRTELSGFSMGGLYQKLQAGYTRKNLSEVTDVTSPPEYVLRPIATNKYVNQPEAQREICQDAERISYRRLPITPSESLSTRNYKNSDVIILILLGTSKIKMYHF